MSASERIEAGKVASKHLPNICQTLIPPPIGEQDLDAMRAAFKIRFDEDVPRTETLMCVAMIGYRMALRDLNRKGLLK